MGASGWKMHMGQLWNPDGAGSNLYASDNPVLELSDGTSIVFFQSKTSTNLYLSRERWKLTKGTNGLYTVVSPTGITYTYKYQSNVAGFYDTTGVTVAECTEIKDVFNNKITISYSFTNGRSYLRTVTDTYGRVATFNYDSTYYMITSVSVAAAGYSTSYSYTYGTTLISATRCVRPKRLPPSPRRPEARGHSSTIPAEVQVLASTTSTRPPIRSGERSSIITSPWTSTPVPAAPSSSPCSTSGCWAAPA